MSTDSTARTFTVALVLCLVCSVVVSTAAVKLRPQQQANKANDKRRNILEVAGLFQEGADVDELFRQIDTRVVELASGNYTDSINADSYEQRDAARDPQRSHAIAAADDIARIGRRADFASVYLVKDHRGNTNRVILPVHGYGLWSTLYGFLALDADGSTIYGLKFYDHAETPGLGGEVDNPRWRSQWRGKLALDDSGVPRIEVVRGRVNESKADSTYQVDGLAGATLTGTGVTNLLRYWLGTQGFGPYLQKLKQG